MRRLLTATAVPVEMNEDTSPSLTALRALKLAEFGDTPAGWAMAAHADSKLFDDTSFHTIAEYALANGDEGVCAQFPEFVKARPNGDWQKALTVCQLKNKDAKAAQVSLDVLRTQPNRDDMFLEVADRNAIGDSKSLPHQLTPLSPEMLALLTLTGLPLPGELYGHPDTALTPALLRLPAKQDVAQLGLAERAAERGLIAPEALEALYQTVTFGTDELQSPLSASATGSRLRALMYRSCVADKDEGHKVTYAIKFLNSAPPGLLAGAGKILGDMVGSIKPAAASAPNALAMAQIYMIAGQGADALEWLRLARTTLGDKLLQSDEYRLLWPQFALAGLESEADFQPNLDRWLDALLKAPDQTTDMHGPRDLATAALVYLDAAGFKIADTSWAKALALPKADKHLALPILLFERLKSVAQENRRAETVVLAVDLAGDAEISLPAAVEIARALHAVGLKAESAEFARQNLASLVKPN